MTMNVKKKKKEQTKNKYLKILTLTATIIIIFSILNNLRMKKVFLSKIKSRLRFDYEIKKLKKETDIFRDLLPFFNNNKLKKHVTYFLQMFSKL